MLNVIPMVTTKKTAIEYAQKETRNLNISLQKPTKHNRRQ